MEPQTEAEFLQEFRLAGLQSVAYACLLGIGVYVAFGAVEALYGMWTPEATFRRLIAVALLGVIVLLVFTRPERVLMAYSLLLGMCSVVAIVGVVSVTRILRDPELTMLINPVSLLALWVLYGFGRLPIRIAVLVGTVGSAFSMFGSRLTNMHEPGIRTAIYLIVANLFGLLLARSIEQRERHLFLQRRIAERAQVELERRSKMAEQASAEKTRLIAAVGHDLRQPMLSAVLHAEVLTQRLHAGDLLGVQRQAACVEESVKVLGVTLEHLLTAARYDSGTEPVHIENVQVSLVFKRLSELFDPLAASRSIDLRIREPLLGLSVQTDEHAFLRVLMNLVSNAIKFTPPRDGRTARVVVRASLRNDSCRIMVADTGLGISEKDLDAIWQPFFQIDNQERDRSKGLGLGLYLVKQSLLRLKNHALTVRSTVGRGTRFVLTLPGSINYMSDATMRSPHRVRPDDSTPSNLRGRYVLLLEDDEEVLTAIEAQFKEWGVSFAAGTNVEEVMEAHSKIGKQVDGIVADFRLPGRLDGLQSIEALRGRLGYDPKAVLITAEVDRERLLGSLPPCTAYVQKPFDTATLRAGLTEVPSQGRRSV